MSARTVLRTFAEGLLAATPFDLQATDTLALVPSRDDVGGLTLGNANRPFDFKVFLGGAGVYFELERNATSVAIPGVTFDFSGPNITSGILNTDTLTIRSGILPANTTYNNITITGATVANVVVANATTNVQSITYTTITINTLNCTTLDFAGASGVLNSTTLRITNPLTGITASTAGLTSQAGLTFKNLTLIPSADDTGSATIGNATLGMDVIWTAPNGYVLTFNRGASNIDIVKLPISSDEDMQFSIVNANGGLSTGASGLSCVNLTTTSFTSATMTIIPAADDTGEAVIGNTTHRVDVVWNPANTSKFTLDVSADRLRFVGDEINTTSPIYSTANIQTPPNLSGGTVTTTGSMTLTAANASITGKSLSVIPGTDDGGVSSFGNATLAQDISIQFGAADSVLFDRGNSRLKLVNVDLDSNAKLFSSGLWSGITTLFCSATTKPTTLNYSGDWTVGTTESWQFKVVDLTASANATTSHYGATVTNNGAGGNVVLTLPLASGAGSGEFIDFLNVDGNSLGVSCVSAGQLYFRQPARSATFTSANKEYLYSNGTTTNTFPFTLGGWIKTSTVAPQMIMRLQSNTVSGGTSVYLESVGGNAAVATCFDPTGGTAIAKKSGNYFDGSWHMLTAVFTGLADKKIYVDGSTSPGTNTVNSTIQRVYNRISVGAISDSGGDSYYVNGNLQNVFHYTKALNTGQIDWLYNGGKGRDLYEIQNSPHANNPGTTNLVYWWRLNENSGTRLDHYSTRDLSDNNTVTSTTPGQVDALNNVDTLYLNTVGETFKIISDNSKWLALNYDGSTLDYVKA